MRRRPTSEELAPRWAEHAVAWRDHQQVAGHWLEAAEVDADLLRASARGAWWETVERLGITLIISREYEHLLLGVSVADGRPVQSHFQVPHPSGIAVDRDRGDVHVALTRNPNQVMTFGAAGGAIARSDVPPANPLGRPLVPASTRFLPGATYLHDLAFIGDRLHGNAVGMNAVVDLEAPGAPRPVWWPRSIEGPDGPDHARNHLQLNSIAAGPDLEGSYFSASAAAPSARRPGHRNWPVDRRGVVFDGGTREPVAGGLTRPHSARLHDGELWIDDSGYGTLCRLDGETFHPEVQLPGWTRGLCFVDGVAFVGTSRVIPRFRQYAPGLDVEQSVCAVHAVDVQSRAVLGSLRWPFGNQIFAIDWLPASASLGFPFRSARPAREQIRRLFYSFDFDRDEGLTSHD